MCLIFLNGIMSMVLGKSVNDIQNSTTRVNWLVKINNNENKKIERYIRPIIVEERHMYYRVGTPWDFSGLYK